MTIPNDPVCAPDGRVYSRSALEAWLAVSEVSPFTRQPMTMDQVHENLHVTQQCRRLLEEEKVSREQHLGLRLRANVVSTDAGLNHHMFSLDPPNREYCAPNERFSSADVIIVVDTSGSTATVARAQDDNNNQLTDGIRIIDLIRHATATVGTALSHVPGARLAVVGFSGTARVIMPLTTLTPATGSSPPAELLAPLEQLVPGGATNLWDGIRTALDIVGNSVELSHTRTPSILLLTDGVPTSAPSRPMAQALESKFQDIGRRCPIHSFGFGTSLHRDLLTDIANVSGGFMSGIPDGGFIGTVFSHAVANVLATQTIDTQLHVTLSDSKCIPDTPLHVVSACTDDVSGERTISYQLGCCQEGQTREAMLTMSAQSVPIAAWVTYTSDGKRYCTPITSLSDPANNNDTVTAHSITRAITSAELRKLGQERRRAYLDSDVQIVYDRADEFFRANLLSGECPAVAETWMDQVMLALSARYYSSWGWIYIDQLQSALMNNVCTNFKDGMIQTYGGRYRRVVHDMVSDVFDKLVLPHTPQCVTRSATGSTYRPVNMAAYNRPSAGCFTSESRVLMASGQMVQFGNIRPGNIVQSVDGHHAHVIAVLKVMQSRDGCLLTEIAPGCSCTPWHPIRSPGGAWIPACQLSGAETRTRECEATYSLALAGGHGLIVGGAGENPICEAASLAHGQQENGLAHKFWGDTVLADMQMCPDYPYVTTTGNAFIRCNGGDVIALRPLPVPCAKNSERKICDDIERDRASQDLRCEHACHIPCCQPTHNAR